MSAIWPALNMSATDQWPQTRQHVHYSPESSLNTLEWCIPRPISAGCDKFWVVFIHGGAWRDPEIDSTSFHPAQELLLRSPENEHIAGFASINYRLSPYPSHPSGPSNPADPSRNARHPDHINDVLAALLHLQETFRFEDRYVLVGHSCGATLALQVAMRRYWGSQYESTMALELNVAPPTAILAIEGIYDISALLRNHDQEPVYRDFITAAFGSNNAAWSSASPAQGNYEDSWPDGKLVVLAYTDADNLVESEQVRLMSETLQSQSWSEGKGQKRRLEVLELHDTHDDIWRKGDDLAKSIEEIVHMLRDQR